jgi:2'-5' RNA ligase
MPREETLRCFVAVPVEAPEVRERLAALRGEAPGGGLKWVALHQLHFTLKFMAELPAALAAPAIAALSQAARGIAPFRLALAGLGTFPRSGPARVLWLACGEGREALEELARRVETAFVAAGVSPEERPFTAHLSLARARDPRAGREAAAIVRNRAGLDAGGVDVHELVLFRSLLGSAGAEHTPMARARLGG